MPLLPPATQDLLHGEADFLSHDGTFTRKTSATYIGAQLKMAKNNNVGQKRPISSVISALETKLPSPLEVFQDFPDPLSLYSLYCVISKKRPCNEKPDQNFRPFKAREYFKACDTYGDYLYWVRILDDFLGERLVYSNSNHRAQLTGFGKHIYPTLMNIFLNLYKQNEVIQNLKTDWDRKLEKSLWTSL